MVLTLETSIIANPNRAFVDRFIGGMVLLMFLSIMSYNQISLLVVYVLMIFYNGIRSYWWITKEDEILRWFRYNLFMLSAFTITYIFSRGYMRGMRQKFQF